MAIDFDADLLEMLNTDEFAVDVVLLLSPNVNIKAIFDSGHLAVDDGITTVSTFGPFLTIRTVDENGIVQDDQLQIGSTTYSVDDIQRDGTGVTTLQLSTVG